MKGSRRHQFAHRERQPHPRHEAHNIEQPRAQCSLWVHDETFSTDDIIFNDAFLPADSRDFNGAVAMIIPRAVFASDSERERIKQQHIPSAKTKIGFGRNDDPFLEAVRFSGNDPKSHAQAHAEYLVFMPKDMSAEQKARSPNLQISVCRKVAKLFGYEDRMMVTVIKEKSTTRAASHVELSFRDVYITRADMRRIAATALRNQALYKGQEIHYLGIKLIVKSIFANQREVKAAVFTDSTAPIFRSESARVILYIQMSREMGEFETTQSGIIIFDKFINTFLPELFKRWSDEKARHLVSIVLFTRMEYDTMPLEEQPQDGSFPTSSNPETNTVRDFYRVVVSHMPSGDGIAILTHLKREYRVFLRDISTINSFYHYDPVSGRKLKKEYSHEVISGKASLARHGNLLEAINLVALQHSQDHVDPDLVRTERSIMIISPGTGYFEVDENMLRLTTENLISKGIGIDLICLSPRPLHTVPVFRFKPTTSQHLYSRTLQSGSPSTSLEKRAIGFNRGYNYTGPVQNTALNSSDDEFVYAIPHWLAAHHYHDPQDPMLKKDKWVPTSRLYEFMMSGIMEIEQSDISIPYQYETHPQFTGIGTGQPAAAEGTDVAVGLNRKHSAFVDEKGNPLAWMDEYDAQLFGSPPIPALNRTDSARKVVPRSPDGNRKPAMDLPKFETVARRLASSPSKNGIPSNENIGGRVRESSIDTSHQLTPKPSKDKLDLLGKGPTGGTKRFGSRPFLMGERGLSFFKAGATTAANYEPYKATELSANNPKAAPSETSGKSSPATSTREVTNAGLMKDTSPASGFQPDSPVNTSMRSAVRSIMESSLGSRRRGSLNVRHGPGFSPVSPSSPWYTFVNPCAPRESDFEAVNYRRLWQHLPPNAPSVSFMNWKPLCTPAALPLTNGYFPAQDELETDFEESSHKIAVDDADVEDIFEARQNLMRELLDFRLSKGFQIVQDTEFKVPVAGNLVASKYVKVFDITTLGEDGTTVFLSKGDSIHILYAVGGDIQVVRYQRRLLTSFGSTHGATLPSLPYKPFFKTAFATSYEQQDLSIASLHDAHNWSAIDQYLAGWAREEFSENLHYWRARFVLIPVEPSKTAHRPNAVLAGDSDDEIHIEGIQKITQIWDKNRYVLPGERLPHAEGRIPDPNPLGLEFQTRDVSIVISTSLEDSLLGREHFQPSTRIFSEPYAFKAADIDLHKLAHAIQGEEGIKMKDRRWFLTLHHNCFVGSDLTSWLLLNVKDITTREQAVELGQRLMDKGLFQHVVKKHPFRDGNYFFAISNDYRELRADTRASWLFRKSDKSVPSTPATEVNKEISTPEKPRQRTARESHTPESEANTPDRPTSNKQTRVKLSAVMEYNVGARKGSNRPEVVKLHYDRLYNPESCLHFRLEWLDANPKLIEDTITLWSTTAEKYGLKLVQVPIAEMRTISERNHFRSPYIVSLSVPPPATARPEQFFDSSSLGPHYSKQRHAHQRALLRHFGFVLDQEAASNFPSDVDVSHSWGKLDYKWTQYIHKTGAVMAQVDDDGRLLLVANRLLHARASALLASGAAGPGGGSGGGGVAAAGTGGAGVAAGIGSSGWTAGVTGGGGGSGVGGVIGSSSGLGSSGGITSGLGSLNTTAAWTPSSKTPITAEAVVAEMNAFCRDEKKLAAFWDECSGIRAGSARTTPAGESMSGLGFGAGAEG